MRFVERVIKEGHLGCTEMFGLSMAMGLQCESNCAVPGCSWSNLLNRSQPRTKTSYFKVHPISLQTPIRRMKFSRQQWQAAIGANSCIALMRLSHTFQSILLHPAPSWFGSTPMVWTALAHQFPWHLTWLGSMWVRAWVTTCQVQWQCWLGIF